MYWLQHSLHLFCTLGPCQCLQLRLKVLWVIAFWLASVDASRAEQPHGKCCWSSLSDDCSEHLLVLKLTNGKQKLTQSLRTVPAQFFSAWFWVQNPSLFYASFCLPLPPQLKAEEWEVRVRRLGRYISMGNSFHTQCQAIQNSASETEITDACQDRRAAKGMRTKELGQTEITLHVTEWAAIFWKGLSLTCLHLFFTATPERSAIAHIILPVL